MDVVQLYLYLHYSEIDGKSIVDDYFWSDELVDTTTLGRPSEWEARLLFLNSVGKPQSEIYVTESWGDVSYAYSMNLSEEDFTRLLELSEYIPNPSHQFFQQGLQRLEHQSQGRFQWYGCPIEKVHHTVLES